MTYDIDEYNEPIKITSTARNEFDDPYKELFEKGLSALLADPYFLLLYVPENRAKMKVIRPANDPEHRKRAIKRVNEAKGVPSFYYALSHLWGISKDNKHLWNEIGEYVDDEQGRPMEPVSMRLEKRDKLLTMLRDHPDSYWWIDVLCARSDTPLDIMGDIYACCLECIAMIDCDPTLISEINKNNKIIDVNIEDIQIYKLELWPLVHKFIKSQWWQRVWTWQEMALPLDVRFMAETGAYQPESAITMKDILALARSVTLWAGDRIDENVEVMIQAVNIAVLDMEDARKFRADDTVKTSKSDLGSLFKSLCGSTRQCMDPMDYVYGMLGILRFKIPRKKDPNDVWQLFLHGLTNYMGDSTRAAEFFDRAVKFDLLKAEKLGDVYSKLFIIYCQLYNASYSISCISRIFSTTEQRAVL